MVGGTGASWQQAMGAESVIRLAIDTSSPVSSVALDCEEAGVFTRELASRDTHSQTLQRALDQLIEESPLSALSQIQSIGIGLGPGSFTGIRIGLSFAKGLSWALKVPLAGVPTFDAMAQCAVALDQRVAVLSDARRGEYFFSAWHVSVGKLTLSEHLRILSTEEVANIVLKHPGEWLIIDAGNEVIPFPDVRVIPARDVAKGILTLMPECEGWKIEDLTSIEPLYVRAVAALTIEDRRKRGML